MKITIFGSLFALAIMSVLSNALEVPEHLKKHAKRLHQRCQNQTQTDEAVIRQSISGQLPNDPKFECYVHCLFDMMGIITESNVMRLESLVEILPAEVHPLILTLSENCGTQEGTDKCNIAFNTLKCYSEASPGILKDKLEFLFD